MVEEASIYLENLHHFFKLLWQNKPMTEENRKHRSAKSIRKDSDRRNMWMAILTLIAGGSIMSGLFFGWQAFFSSLPFLILGGLLIFIPWLFLRGLDIFMEWLENRE
ncbi:MAG: hypothetical protein ACI9EW_000668 [Cellvibrionaceae bacterium]|jgi:hypothetical protein